MPRHRSYRLPPTCLLLPSPQCRERYRLRTARRPTLPAAVQVPQSVRPALPPYAPEGLGDAPRFPRLRLHSGGQHRLSDGAATVFHGISGYSVHQYAAMDAPQPAAHAGANLACRHCQRERPGHRHPREAGLLSRRRGRGGCDDAGAFRSRQRLRPSIGLHAHDGHQRANAAGQLSPWANHRTRLRPPLRARVQQHYRLCSAR